MRKRDYEAIAKTLRRADLYRYHDAVTNIALNLAFDFEHNNLNFDREAFLEMCGVDDPRVRVLDRRAEES